MVPGVQEVDLEPDPPALFTSTNPIESSDEFLGEPQNAETDSEVPFNPNSIEPPEGVGDGGELAPDVPIMILPNEPPPS